MMGNKNSMAMTVNETARRLQVRLDTVYKALYAGLLTGERIDGKWQISAASVENYLANHSRKAAASLAAPVDSTRVSAS